MISSDSLPPPESREGAPGSNGSLGPASSDHVCQFYETDDFLYDSVASFLADGLTMNQPVIVFSTAAHWDGIAALLEARGVDAGDARIEGEISVVEADEVLERVMDGDAPDPRRFEEIVGTEVARVAAHHPGGSIRIFGELVDLAWRAGNPDAALRLEDLWNELRRNRTFQLLCAYSMGNFYRETHASHVEEIRRRHGRMAPAEGENLPGNELPQKSG